MQKWARERGARAEIADREGSSFGSGEEQVFYFSLSDAAIPKTAYAESESHGAFKVLTTWKHLAMFMLLVIQSVLDFSMYKIPVKGEHKRAQSTS